jgi:tRNA (cytidine32/uridine32-2'-O)-methyltransferase
MNEQFACINQANITFVLVRPVFLGNIGSTARVLKNFGFSRIYLVEPPRNYKESEARRMSVGAFDLLKEAKVYPTLDLALKDISLAFATSSGQQRLLSPLIPFADVHRLLISSVKNQIAFVFGDERDGLRNEEIDRCHHTLTIRANPIFPSLNVAQAVGIVAYELARMQTSLQHRTYDEYATGALDDEVIVQLKNLLTKVEFSRKFNHNLVLRQLRSCYQRMHPSKREAELLKGILHRLNQKLTDS